MKKLTIFGFGASVVLVYLVSLLFTSGEVYAQSEGPGLNAWDLQHIHYQAFDEEGFNSTGEMGDGNAPDLLFYLRAPSGEYVWQICPTRSGGNQESRHWFHPAYGNAPKFRDSTSERSNIGNLDDTRCGGAEPGTAEWANKGANPKWWFQSKLNVGDVYTVVAVGVGGNLPFVPDANSQYYDEMTIKVTEYTPRAQLPGVYEYEYSGFDKKQTGTKEQTLPDGTRAQSPVFDKGESYTLVYRSTQPNLCPGLSSADNCLHNVPHDAPSNKKYFTLNVFSTEGGGIISIINTIINFLINDLIRIIRGLTGALTNIIVLPHSYFTGAHGQMGLLTGWQVARGIANSVFILFLIGIAMANIFRYNIEQYNVRAAIPRLIIAIILTNFSLLLIGFMADLANVAILGLQQGFGALGQNSSYAAGINSAVAEATGLTALTLLFTLIALVVFLMVFLLLILLLTLRVGIIVALSALAPIAFMLYGFPATAGLFQKWWQNLLRFLFIGPVVVFLLLLAASFIDSVKSESPIIGMFAGIAMMLIALMSPMALGGSLMQGVTGALKKYGKALGRPVGARAMRTTAARKLSAGLTGMAGKENRFVRGFAKATGLKAAGIGLGRAQAGQSAQRQKKMEDFARSLSPKAKRTRMNVTKDADEAIAMAKSLNEIGLLEDVDAAQLFGGTITDKDGKKTTYEAKVAQNHAGYQEALGMAYKATADDPRIADVISNPALWPLGSDGEPSIPPKVRGGTSGRTRNLGAFEIAKLSPSILKDARVRENVTMTAKTASSMSAEQKEALTGVTNFTDFESKVRAIKADLNKRGVKGDDLRDQLREAIETAFPDQEIEKDGKKVKVKGFQALGGEGAKGQAARDAMISSVDFRG